MRTIFIILAIFFSTLYLFTQQQPIWFSIFIKILPLIFMMLYILTFRYYSAFNKWIFLGLFFCMLGDATLHWFLVGLTFFVIGHLCYIYAFLIIKEKNIPKSIMILLLLFGVIIAGWVVGNIMAANNIFLAIAVTLYIAIILTMAWAASQTNKLLIWLGAICFLLSDTFLAINMFITALPHHELFVMPLYYGAQLLFTLQIAKYFVIQNKVIE